MNSSGTLKIARNGYIVMAVVFCALGIFLMAVPEKAVKIICVLAGILFLADGIIKIIGYFSRDFYCLAFQFDLGFGILMIAVGILILVRREAILRLIFVIFGLVILDHIKKCTDQLVVRYGNDLIYICFNIREQLISRSAHCCTICNCVDTRKAYNMISL